MRALVILVCALSFYSLHAQLDTLVYKPGNEDGIDAWISDKYPNGNYGAYGEVSAAIWVSGSSNNVVRSLMDFRLYGLPPGSNILSAHLTLHVFGFPFNWNGSPLYGTNDFYISRITQPWSEDSVTWNNAPAFDTVLQVYVSPTTAPAASRTIDVSGLIIDRWLNPGGNCGMLFRMVNETTPFAVAAFASSDNANPILHPELCIIYDISTGDVSPGGEKPGIHVWPNPVQDQLHVRAQSGFLEEVAIFDVAGRIIFQEIVNRRTSQHSFSLNELELGTYLMRARTTAGYFGGKIIKY